MKNLIRVILIVFSLFGCKSQKSGKEYQQAYLLEKNYVADITIDDNLGLLIPEVNCIIKKSTPKYFVTADSFNVSDTNQILIVPFRRKNEIGTSSGFSDLIHRVVFICPLQIKDFVKSNSLNDTTDIAGYLGIILLHEISHFVAGVPGSFDEGDIPQPSSSALGEQDMGTTPVYNTTDKQLEFKVDSLAIEMVKSGMQSKDFKCINCSINVQLAVGGAEFMIFGKRLIEHFGAANSKLLRDKSWSHPNLELRLAFMNYYLNPTEEKRSQIDDYLYEREVAPINRQLIDPRIYQGDSKILNQ